MVVQMVLETFGLDAMVRRRSNNACVFGGHKL